MLTVHVEDIGEIAVVECEGRIGGSDAALKLHDAVTSQRDARIIVLDLSETPVLENEGLSLLVFLQRWANEQGIRLKLFNPRQSIRNMLEGVSSMSEFDIATLDEIMALLLYAQKRHARAA